MEGVLLGMPGAWADDYREKSDHYTTKIGGLPDWPVPESSIEPALLKCAVCGERLCLVAQVYAPVSLPDMKIEERVIYVLGCAMPECGTKPSSWRVLRIQKCENQSETEMDNSSTNSLSLEEDSSNVIKTSNWLKEGLFVNGCGDEEDEVDDDMDLEALGQALFAASSMASQSKKQINSSPSEAANKGVVAKPEGYDARTPVLPCFYIYSQKVQSTSDVNSVCANYSSLSIKEKQNTPSDNEEEEKWEGEVYEYDSALGADRTYLKFKKQIDAHPEQCFRYAYGGKPLLATTNFEIPNQCKICGSLRRYEMQLMPSLLYFLNQASDGPSNYSPNEWSWLTLIIYTCSKSCCPSSCKEKENGSYCWTMVEEAITIQEE